MIRGNLQLKQGYAVAFDFDGVTHKYSDGWKDGTIYDDYNKEVLDLILLLNAMKIPVFILSTREPKQIKEWWGSQGFSIPCRIIKSGTLFWNDLSCIGITKEKIPAQVYVDDRGYKYTGQTVKEFLMDFTQNIKTDGNIRNVEKDNDWIPVVDNDDCMPKDKYYRKKVWVTIETEQGNRFTVQGFTESWKFYFSNGTKIKNYKVVAWKPYDMPSPYKG